MIIAIDPGTTQSAVVYMYDDGGLSKEILPNNQLRERLKKFSGQNIESKLAVEMIASYGMPVGKEVFETCLWIGHFIEAWSGGKTINHNDLLVYRKDVKIHLCGNNRAKDANIRQALIDIYGPGKDKAIGKKATPGPLYGFKADMWAALGVAVTFNAKQNA